MSEELVTCTFAKTNRSYTIQPWYECLDCQVKSVGLCVSCAQVCHAGHQLSEIKNSRFYCDCGFGSFRVKNGLCKCLKPTPKVQIPNANSPDNSISTPPPVGSTSNSTPSIPTLTPTIQSQTNPSPSIPTPTPTNKNSNTNTNIALDNEIKNEISKFTTFINPLKGAIDRKDPSSISNWRQQVTNKFKSFEEKYDLLSNNNQIALDFISSTRELLKTAQVLYESLVVQQNIDSEIKAMSSMVKSLEGALARKDPSSCKNWTEEINKKLVPLNERYSQYPVAKQFIDSVNVLLERVRDEVPISMEDQKATEMIKQMSQLVSVMESSFNGRDYDRVLRCKSELDPFYRDFKSKYNSNRFATAYIASTDRLLERIRIELGPIIVEQEIKEEFKEIDRLKYMFSYVLRDQPNNLDLIASNKQAIQDLVNGISTKYGDKIPSDCRSNFEETKAFLSQIENTFGGKIAEREIGELPHLMKTLQSAIDRSDLKSIAKWYRVLQEQYQTLKSKYESNPIITQVKELLGKVNLEFGQNLIQNGISSMSIDDTVGKVECSNANKNTFEMYMCLTCYSSPGATSRRYSICSSCRDICHVGHTIGPKIRTSDQCKCGEGYFDSINGSCQCLRGKKYPRQDYEPFEWVTQLGVLPTDQELQFIINAYDNIIEIERTFSYSDKRGIAGLVSMTFNEAAKKLKLDLVNGRISGFVKFLQTKFQVYAKELMKEWWPSTLNEFKKQNIIKLHQSDEITDERTENLLTRSIYFDRYHLVPWGFIQGTPSGRELFEQAWSTMIGNTKILKSPIPWMADKDEQTDQFWNRFKEITNEDIPSFDWIPKLEQLLLEYDSKLPKTNRYNYEYRSYAQDFLDYLREVRDNTCLPSDFPKRFGPNKFGSVLDLGADDLLFELLYRKEWSNVFDRLNRFKNTNYEEYKEKCKEKPEEFKRYTQFHQEFSVVIMNLLSITAMPLLLKHIHDGDIEKSEEIITQYEKHLPLDKSFLETMKSYQDIKAKRNQALTELQTIDNELKSILSSKSNEFRPKVEEYIQSVNAKDFNLYDVTKEIIPHIDEFRDRSIVIKGIDQEEKTSSPIQQIYQVRNGNWKLEWSDTVNGGDLYKSLELIMIEIQHQILKKYQLQLEPSRDGKDQLNLYLLDRANHIKNGSTNGWSCVGKIQSIHNYTETLTQDVESEAAALLLVPPNGRLLSLEKIFVGTSINTTTTIRYTNIAFDTTRNNYVYQVTYEVYHSAIILQVNGFICDYFSSLDSNNSLELNVIPILKQLVAK
eukprot:gene5683-7073_t